MKKIIYTAIFNNRDIVKHYDFINKDFDYYLIVDKATYEHQKAKISTSHWELVDVEENVEDSRLMARQMKIQEFININAFDFSIWVDGSFNQVGDANLLVTNNNFLTIEHPATNCVYEHSRACKNIYDINNEQDILNIKKIDAQVEKYENKGFPKYSGLAMTGIICRYHNEYNFDICNNWWEELKENSLRDQISLPYTLWDMEKTINTIPLSYANKVFENKPHFK